MKRTILIYGLAIAAAAALLQWLQYRYAVRVFSTEIFIGAIAVLFTLLGIWVGNRLTRRSEPQDAFEKNEEAIAYLGISDREYDVLNLLAEGHSNKEIAKRLFVSANTVKTHLAHLFAKLDASRRIQAVQKARSLRLIP
jgi:DNA-binding CsgD family transcriptional regulator